MTREDYQDRQDRKIEKYQDLAHAARQRANAVDESARSMASVIPFGQPILVGHHSEGRDRRYRAKIESKFRRAYEESSKADYWESRAQSAEENTSISSDDPDAVTKLAAKIEQLEEVIELWKAINKIARSRKSLDAYPESARAQDIQEEFGFNEDTAKGLVEDAGWQGRGIPAYRISNMRQNITRYKKRLEEMKARQQETEQEKEFETTEGTVKIVYNVYENRAQIVFPGKPSAETRTILKRQGLRWSPRQGAWQRQLNNQGKWAVKTAVKQILCDPETMDTTTYNLV